MTDRLFKASDQVVVAALVASSSVTRTSTVGLSTPQAWADVGLPVPLAAETTTFYEVSLQVSWPAHTTDGGEPFASELAAMKVRTLNVAVTRDAATGVVVVTDGGDCVTADPWNVGRVSVRIVGDGASGWQIEAQRGVDTAYEAVVGTVLATVRTLTSRDWDDAATPAVVGGLASDTTAGLMSSTHYTAVSSAAEAPTGGVFPIRTSAGVLRATGLKCEKATTVTFDVTAVDGTTPQAAQVNCSAFNIAATSTCYVACSSFTETDVGEAYSCTRTYAAATTIVFNADIASLAWTHAQDASAAGGTTTLRAQRGFAGFVGGDFIIGGGDGGTTGTNLGGNTRVKLGTLVSNTSAKFILEDEGGTGLLQMYKYAASSFLIRPNGDGENLVLGGSSGASGNSITMIPNSYITMGVISGYLLVSSQTVYYESAAKKIYGSANQEEYEHRKTNTITTATAGNLDTHLSIANSTIAFDAEVVVRNNSDSLGVRVKITGGLYRNDAGTITTLVAATVNATEGDATEAGNVTIGFSWSTNTLQITYSFANAKNRKIYSQLWVRNGC